MMSSTACATGVWRHLRLVPELAVPDVPLAAGAWAAVVVEGGMLRWVGPQGAVPAAYAALQKVTFTNAQIAEMAKLVDVDGMEPEDAATEWMKANEAVWKPWTE